MRVAGEDVVEAARADGLLQRGRPVAVEREAVLAGQDEIRRFRAFDAGGAGLEGSVFPMGPVAVADGDMGPDAVFKADGRHEIHDVLAGVAAMDEMPRAAAQQQVQRAPRLGQVVVGVG